MGRVPIAIPGRVVLFDYGEVITLSPSREAREAILRAAGVPGDAFWRAYRTERDALDQGLIPTTEYWARIGRACGVEWDLPTLQELWTLDVRGWTTPNPDVVRVIGELHGGGTRLAVLSNASAEYGGLLRFAPLGGLFEQVFVSAELLLLKPEAAIYRHAAAALAVPPAEVVFVDNREDNVRGAEAVGMTGHVFTGADALRGFLQSLEAAA